MKRTILRPRRSSLQHLMCALLLVAAAAAGCSQNASPDSSVDVQAVRTKVLLDEEPGGAVTALGLRDQDGGFADGAVVLVGKIGGMPNPWEETGAEKDFPWRAGQATFFVVDPATVAEFAGHEHAAGEDHEDCVFCNSRAAASMESVVAVQISGADGDPLPIDARKLLDVKEGDIVVVRGAATQIGGNLIVLDANGLYVRR